MSSTKQKMTDSKRLAALREILNHARNEALARVREFREEQDQDAEAAPGDEMDVARSLAEVETHASLIERIEQRLKAIDEAFTRLDQGLYGICEDCGGEIPVARLKALPFATCCVDCQEKRNHGERVGQGAVDESSRRFWQPPEEMDERFEKGDAMQSPEEGGVIVHEGKPGGAEVGEFEQLPPAPTARRRGRPRKKQTTEE